MEALNAKRLCLTHFGPIYDPGYHLSRVMPEVEGFIDLGSICSSGAPGSRRSPQALTAKMAHDLDGNDAEVLASYEMATPAYMAAMGIERLYRKRTG